MPPKGKTGVQGRLIPRKALKKKQRPASQCKDCFESGLSMATTRRYCPLCAG